MQTVAISALALLLPLLAISCRAADSTQPATAPEGLQSAAHMKQTDGEWSVEITLTNATDHPLATGRFLAFSVTRTDTTPPQVVAKSPEHTMAPHFRMVIAAGESKTTELPVWTGSTPLPAGTYRVSVTFPRDVLRVPVEADFHVKAPSETSPAQP